MKKTSVITLCLAIVLGGTALPAAAEKPEWAGGAAARKDGGGPGHKERGRHARAEREPRTAGYFDDRDRRAARDYFRSAAGKGCPPGLAKKNNGCLPPGQAKKLYALGQPLPAGVVVYPVPQPVLVRLPPAPAGHKYVRVAADILLIAVGTAMVIDAIEDLGRI